MESIINPPGGGGGGTFVKRVQNKLADKTSFAGTTPEQVGTSAVFDHTLLPSLDDVTVYVSATMDVFNTVTAAYLNVRLEVSLDGGATWLLGKEIFLREGSSGNASTGLPLACETQETGDVTGQIRARLMAWCSAGASTSFDIMQAAMHMEILV